MLDRYIKVKMDAAKRIKGLSALNVTPKRVVSQGRSSCTDGVAYPSGVDAVEEAEKAQAEMRKPRKAVGPAPFYPLIRRRQSMRFEWCRRWRGG